jgi:hypothetical protein
MNNRRAVSCAFFSEIAASHSWPVGPHIGETSSRKKRRRMSGRAKDQVVAQERSSGALSAARCMLALVAELRVRTA